MRSPSSRRRRPRTPRQPRIDWLSRGPVPWPLVFWCGILYAAIGVILAAFPVPAWVWIVALFGTLVQISTLAGPQTLRRFKWLAANLLVLGSSLGAGLTAVALAIALNYAATDQLDELTLGGVFWEVVRYSLFAVGLAALCGGVTASLGDRLLRHFQRQQTVLILITTALLGLSLGGAFGFLLR